jgi:hypothetical protein
VPTAACGSDYDVDDLLGAAAKIVEIVKDEGGHA